MKDFEIFEYYRKIPIPNRLWDDVLDSDYNRLDFIEGLSKVNLFVGTNNSGKSLILRELLKESKIENYPSQKIKEAINSFIRDRLEEINKILEDNKYEYIFQQGYSHNMIISNNKLKEIFTEFDDAFETVSDYAAKGILELRKMAQYSPISYYDSDEMVRSRQRIPKDIKDQIKNCLNRLNDFLNSLEKEYVSKVELAKVYIPTIRSLRKYENPRLLEGKTKKEYGFDDSILIQNGQDMFTAIQDMMMDTYEIQQRKTDFENFLSQEFFQGQEVRLTPNKKLNELTLKIGIEKERPIFDLGEGLQMMLILTFPIFFFEAGIVTIEEPEIFLHPGFQHKLINTFSNHPKSRNFIFLISTHSNHILDNVNYQQNISVYSSVKTLENKNKSEVPKFIISKLSEPGSGLLNLLGVRNTSVFLSNTTIWVEGITDMLYMRKYLGEYLKGIKTESKYHVARKFQEGIHYSFILTGGSSIIHYDFSDKSLISSLKNKVVVKNICGKAYVIVDNDGNKHKSRKQKFFKDLNGRFKEIPVIEIENLLSNEVIKATIHDFPSCGKISIDDDKLLEESEYAEIRLGSYIDDHLLKDDKTKRRKQFKENKDSDNSTLNCKFEFCQKAIQHIEFDLMTKSSKKLVEDMLDFMIEKNLNST